MYEAEVLYLSAQVLPQLVLPVGLALLLALAGLALRRRWLVPLMRAERMPWPLFTGGWSPWTADAAPEGDVNRLDALALGVAPERILTTGPVRNTADGATPHVLLVTSAFHMPRSVTLFERAGLRVTPFPVDFRQDAARRVTLVDLFPSGRALAETETGASPATQVAPPRSTSRRPSARLT